MFSKKHSSWDTTEIISRLAVLPPPKTHDLGGSAHLFKSANFGPMTVM